MDTSNTSILVVDDLPSAMSELEDILFGTDFFNVEFCAGAIEALQFMEDNPIQILIASWQMEDMDGLELAQHVKEIDEEHNLFTFVVLYSKQEPDASIREAFKSTVDGFLKKEDLKNRLPGLLFVAERITNSFRELLSARQGLEIECKSLKEGLMRDPLTGLGNRKQMQQSLNDTIKQIEARGGAVCFLLIGLENYQQLLNEQSDHVMNELLIAIAKRLLQLVRPLDVVTYCSEGQFGLVLLQPSIDMCTADCYRRIFDGVRLKNYLTSNGYLTVPIGMSICASEALTGPPHADIIIQNAEGNLENSFSEEEIQVTHLNR